MVGSSTTLMKKYKLPIAFQVHIDSDPGLQQLKKDGEENNRPESEFFKAALAYTLDTRRNLLIELGRYMQKHGPLEPMDYDTGATIEAKEEVPQKEANEYPELRELPKPEQDINAKRFSKSYE
jgi:hypothetical protein